MIQYIFINSTYCVCTCNSILCVLPLIDMFRVRTNAKMTIIAHSNEGNIVECFLFVLSLLVIRVGLPLFITFSLMGCPLYIHE